MGRQLFLNLRQAAETVEYERDLALNEIDTLRNTLGRGEELYNALGEAYKVLQEEGSRRIIGYEKLIQTLKEENAFNTAQILEQHDMEMKAANARFLDLQDKMQRSSVSETTSRNTRSNMNTPFALRKFMQERGIEETPAGSARGTVSKKILFVIKNGRLHKRQNGKADIDLEDGSADAPRALIGLDPVWTMAAITHSLPEGTKMFENGQYREEAKAIRDSGKLLTHEESTQLQRYAEARRNLPAIQEPSEITTPIEKRARNDSFYGNVTPNVTEKKKVKKGEGLRGRGLRGAGVNGTINLRERRGASAMDYKEIGSKFIRLPDLHNRILNLKYNNRTSVINKREMSEALTDLIKELVFDSNINQAKYDKLSHSDKKIFVDVLKMTHLQYHIKNPLEDPNERLIAEWDKLRGEIELGNTNPEIIRELKALSLDLYSQKMISDEAFKSIIMALN